MMDVSSIPRSAGLGGCASSAHGSSFMPCAKPASLRGWEFVLLHEGLVTSDFILLLSIGSQLGGERLHDSSRQLAVATAAVLLLPPPPQQQRCG